MGDLGQSCQKKQKVQFLISRTDPCATSLLGTEAWTRLWQLWLWSWLWGHAALPWIVWPFLVQKWSQILHQKGATIKKKWDVGALDRQWSPNGTPKLPKWRSMKPPKLPKWTPELTKWSFGDAKTHKMDPKTAEMKHWRTPKLQNQRKQRWPS